MRVLVYVPRYNVEAALARVAELRAERYNAAWVDAGRFDGQTEPCQRVLTDIDAVREAFEAKGVEVQPFTVIAVDPPADIPAPRRRRKDP